MAVPRHRAPSSTEEGTGAQSGNVPHPRPLKTLQKYQGKNPVTGPASSCHGTAGLLTPLWLTLSPKGHSELGHRHDMDNVKTINRSEPNGPKCASRPQGRVGVGAVGALPAPHRSLAGGPREPGA